jgi:hypothetical protein
VNDTEPPLLEVPPVPTPPVKEISPPRAALAVVFPELTTISPPVPVLPVPRERTKLPALPLTALPVDILTIPESPELEDPVINKR